MSLSDRDYQSLAKAIVCDYTDSQIPLKDSLVKVADAQEMNVHETRRLLEATNVHAHLTLFKTAGEEDKYVEFDVVDPGEVCQELFGRVDTPDSDEPHEKVAAYVEADHHLELPNEHLKESHSTIEKAAAALVPEDPEPVFGPYEGARGYYAYARVNKVAEELENTIREKYIEYNESIDKIASTYQSIYADDFTEFEKDAKALYGDDADHVVSRVCNKLHRKPSRVKTANHYPIDKPVLKKLASAVELYRDLKDHIDALEQYRKQAEPLLHG